MDDHTDVHSEPLHEAGSEPVGLQPGQIQYGDLLKVMQLLRGAYCAIQLRDSDGIQIFGAWYKDSQIDPSKVLELNQRLEKAIRDTADAYFYEVQEQLEQMVPGLGHAEAAASVLYHNLGLNELRREVRSKLTTGS